MSNRKPFESFDEIPHGAVNSYDIDGVIYMGESYDGVYPGPNDIIITGRSSQDRKETEAMLLEKGITNPLYMNPKSLAFNSRKQSGQHKAMTMFYLEQMGYHIACHYEDDPIQIEAINKMMPHIRVIHLDHNLIDKGVDSNP